MRKFIQSGLMLALVILFNGCAQGYYAINPSKIAYNASNTLDDITLNYRYDILRENGNKKMSKKEKNYNIKLVAVKITNNTDTVINIGKNAAFFSGSTKTYPMDAISTKYSLKQSVPSHLLYLLLSTLTLTINDNEPLPVGLILGPGLAGGNMLVAASANNHFYINLLQYDILYRDIQPGETVYGLVGFRNLDYVPLTVKLIK